MRSDPARRRRSTTTQTWTGSVVRGDDGLWNMFYTGISHAERGQVQRIGVATSPDLHSWTKRGRQPVVTSDGRWYQQFAATGRPEAWRDPWVIRDPEGDGWHMVVTACALGGRPTTAAFSDTPAQLTSSPGRCSRRSASGARDSASSRCLSWPLSTEDRCCCSAALVPTFPPRARTPVSRAGSGSSGRTRCSARTK